MLCDSCIVMDFGAMEVFCRSIGTLYLFHCLIWATWNSLPQYGSISSSCVCCRKVKPPKRAMTAGCFEGHEGPIRCIYLWKEKHLLTGSEDGTVRQYKLKVSIQKESEK